MVLQLTHKTAENILPELIRELETELEKQNPNSWLESVNADSTFHEKKDDYTVLSF